MCLDRKNNSILPPQLIPHQWTLPQTRHSTSAIWASSRPCCKELSVQFVLTAKRTEAKSKKLVIWAPTVVMRHLQRSHPNQIFGSAASDALSHIVTVVLAGELARWGWGDQGVGTRRRAPSLQCHVTSNLSCPWLPLLPSETAAPLGHRPTAYN